MPERGEARGTSGGVFFFQAEDGIRDPVVTGVQTCALPIFLRFPFWGLLFSGLSEDDLASGEKAKRCISLRAPPYAPSEPSMEMEYFDMKYNPRLRQTMRRGHTILKATPPGRASAHFHGED